MRQQVSPVTNTTSYQYDAAGNLDTTVDSDGRTTTRTYDAVGRVLTATAVCNDTEVVTWTYDDATTGAHGIGRLSSMTDPSGSTTYAYERRGLLLSEQRMIGTSSYSTAYEYDADGNRTRSGDLESVYDYAGRPISLASQATVLVSSASYLPFGPETEVVFGNTLAQRKTYDARYRLTSNQLVPTGTGGALATYEYQYDGAGNITSIHDAADDTYDRGFGYDDLNRLTTAEGGASLWGTGTYNYDAMGNVTALTIGNRNAAMTYAGLTPRISDVSEQGRDMTMQYDGAGNELGGTSSGTWGTFSEQRTYSCRNLMTEVRLEEQPAPPPCEELPCDPPPMGTVLTATYVYDGRGVRVRSSGNAGPERDFLYTPELQLHARVDTATETRETFAWFNGRPIAQINDTATVRYTFTDHLGTPILQTGAAIYTPCPPKTHCPGGGGSYSYPVVWRAEYEPYGNIYQLRAGSPDEQPLRLPGQEFAWTSQSGTEESYNIFRWYRSGWGRYTQSDPLGKKGDAHPYLYATGNPLTNIDPVGEKARSCCTPISGGPQPFNHCFIQVVDEFTNGDSTYALHRLKAGVGCKFKDDGFDIDAIDNPKTQCGPWSEGCQTDQCVAIEHAFYPRPIDYFYLGSLAGSNSNTYAAHITSKCKLQPPPMAGSWQTPGWNSPAPQANPKKTCPPSR
jgi:RHS repeat-associated protein